MKDLNKAVLKTLNYFSFFNYPANFEEIYIFLPNKISKKNLKTIILKLEQVKKIKKINERYLINPKYTPPEYIKNLKMAKKNNLITKQFNNFQKRYLASQKKLKNWRFKIYLKLLSFFPQIKLVGLSGTLAMMNAKKEDDIDLFIITAKNRLFTARFIALILAQIFGLRRKRNMPTKFTKNKVCLNLFFDERDLTVPNFKKNQYVAHEVLQMKPLIIKENINQRFLEANDWVFDIFPNAKFKIQNFNDKKNLKWRAQKFNILKLISYWLLLIWIFNMIEKLLKGIQLYFIKTHTTSEIITDTQLWFHPKDFENELKLKGYIF